VAAGSFVEGGGRAAYGPGVADARQPSEPAGARAGWRPSEWGEVVHAARVIDHLPSRIRHFAEEERDDFVDLRELLPFDLPEEDLPEDERLRVDDLLEEDFFAVEFFVDDLPDDFEDFLLPLEPLFPLPDFLPPPDCLFTVAQARRSASPFDTPRSS
jgi:hypothetical protein